MLQSVMYSVVLETKVLVSRRLEDKNSLGLGLGLKTQSLGLGLETQSLGLGLGLGSRSLGLGLDKKVLTTFKTPQFLDFRLIVGTKNICLRHLCLNKALTCGI